jgi:hypothetical protein
VLKTLLLAALTATLLAGCAARTVPLPTIQASDPVWGLVPDRLPGGALPR